SGSKKVAFVHPDLGIGGAERLVVDAAVGLQNKGHSVVMYTSHHDKNHCFQETRDGTLNVEVFGDFLPRHLLGRFHILFATLRGIYLAIVILLTQSHYDVIIVDQLSVPVPILLATGSKIVFYCHFPDLKLSGRRSLMKSLYRLPFDWLEEFTTLLAHRILVNSKYTAQVFHETFASAKISPEVLYPSINLKSYERNESGTSTRSEEAGTCFVSINRFERKKNIDLAVKAFDQPKDEFGKLRLIIAGGYDPRVTENVEYKRELEGLSKSLAVSDQIIFKASFSDEERSLMLSHCFAVIYTPSNEHFGIVPIEAMYSQRPVLACNSGGPTESVLHEKTGLLCEATEEDFASGMNRMLKDRSWAREMGANGRKRVQENFSLDAFSQRLHEIIRSL
ncbi:hypothetical protein GUITHDRAFT_74012, partial [Guillardia theta CCMP2712]